MKPFIITTIILLCSFRASSQSSEGGYVKTQNDCLIWTIDKAYKIEWTGSCVDGYAEGKGDRIIFDSEGKWLYTFTGNLKNGKGESGVSKWANGLTYEGTFIDGLDRLTGIGKFEFLNSDKKKVTYTGNLKNGFKQGKGKTYVNDRLLQEGIYLEGLLASGIVNYENGEKYEGTFKSDGNWDIGKYFYNNGDKYEGKFDKNEMMKKGFYKYANGDEDTYFGDGTIMYKRYYDSNWKGCNVKQAMYYRLVKYLGKYASYKKPVSIIDDYYVNGKRQGFAEKADHVDFDDDTKSILKGKIVRFDLNEKVISYFDYFGCTLCNDSGKQICPTCKGRNRAMWHPCQCFCCCAKCNGGYVKCTQSKHYTYTK